MIKWDVFFENSSSRDDLICFVEGDLDIDDLFSRHPRVEKEMKKLRKMGSIKTMTLAIKALKRRNYILDKIDPIKYTIYSVR